MTAAAMAADRAPRDIVMTGAGVVTPIGDTLGEFWRSNLEGRSGLQREHEMGLSDLPCGWNGGIIGEPIRNAVRERWMTGHRSWGDALLQSVIDQAVSDADLKDDFDKPVGLYWVKSCPGSGCTPAEFEAHVAEQASLRRVAGDDFRAAVNFYREVRTLRDEEEASTCVQDLHARLGAPLIAARLEATCAGGLRAIAEGARLLLLGKADVAIVAGAVSRRSHYVLSQYAQLMALSRWKGDAAQASMPFDRRRSGMVIGEGAAAIILETAEHAARRGVERVYAELGGWGLAVDTAHVTAPNPEMVERVMRSAIAHSGLEASAIDIVNAHGTSTRLNDVTESRALHRILGNRISDVDVSAVKSLTGHASAASGILETIVTALTLCEGVVPPVVTCTDPDPECGVKTNLEPVRRYASVALKNSFGFGGQYASMVLRRPSHSRVFC